MLAPDGRSWKVSRQWLPSTRVRVRRERDLPDLPDASWLPDVADAGAGGVLAAFAIVIVGIFLLLVVWPVVALALELVILLVLFLAGIVGRLVLRRPWRIVARSKSPGPKVLAWNVVGWRASGRVIGEVEQALRSGADQPRPAGASPVSLQRPS